MERFIIRQSTGDSQGKSWEHTFKLVHSPHALVTVEADLGSHISRDGTSAVSETETLAHGEVLIDTDCSMKMLSDAYDERDIS